MARRHGDNAQFARLLTGVFISLQLIIAIGIVVLATKFSESVMEGIDRATAVCKTASVDECVKVGNLVKNVIRYVYIGAVLSCITLCLVALVGCTAACSGHRTAMCVFVVFTSVLLIVLLIALIGASVVAGISANKKHDFVRKFHKFVNTSMRTVNKVLKDVKTQAAFIVTYQNVTMNARMRDMMNELMLHDNTSEDRPTLPVQVQSQLQQVADVFTNVSVLVRDGQLAVDWLQKTFDCCGAEVYKDWDTISLRYVMPYEKNIPWWAVHFSDEKGNRIYTWDQLCVSENYQCFVPASCCKPDSGGKEKQCNAKHATKNDVVDKRRIFTQACRDAMVNKVHEKSSQMSIVFATIVLCTIGALISTWCTRGKLGQPVESDRSPPPVEKGESASRASVQQTSLVLVQETPAVPLPKPTSCFVPSPSTKSTSPSTPEDLEPLTHYSMSNKISGLQEGKPQSASPKPVSKSGKEVQASKGKGGSSEKKPVGGGSFK